MIAKTFYDKALSNFKTAKIIFKIASDDEEQLNIIGYHIQQSIEFAIKHIFCLNAVPVQKTHDLDQLIRVANEYKVDLFLPEYLIDQSETLSNWELKTRYSFGFAVEYKKIEKMLLECDKYFTKLSTILTN